ncbi:DUF4845 domain-containing protein [Marinobacterium jannaschii]|uniref:DUF4845 domain-containing protein n=1 Tax=Marinobacterium jannaschii TaxID=64970 RepID=UPI0004862455|nr:DUF4845 domain-containing protein [Marinobacterium jannaschii]
MEKNAGREKGASTLSILIVLIVAGFLFSIAFKLYPAYWDYYLIDSVLTDVIQDQDELKKTNSTMKRDLQRKFRINAVKLPQQDSIVFERERGVVRFNLNYEVRVPMFYNVDALVKFEKKYEAIAP